MEVTDNKNNKFPCSECDKIADKLITFDDGYDINHICKDCLKKALEMLE